MGKRIIIISLLLITVLPVAVAAQVVTPDEREFLRQSKTCEAATRLPNGDVHGNAWADCMWHRRIRTLEEERRSDQPRTPWSKAVGKSLLFATSDGCESWAGKQPSDPPRRKSTGTTVLSEGVYSANHAWNLCMEQHGVFTVPKGRTFPDYRGIAAEQRTVTIMEPESASPVGLWHHYGCHTQNRYDELLTVALNDLQPPSRGFVDSRGRKVFPTREELEAERHNPVPPGPTDVNPEEAAEKRLEEWRQKQRELFATSKDCRLWNDGERVQVKSAARKALCLGFAPPCPVFDLLCLSPAGSNEPCYWSGAASVDAWE